VPVQGRTLHFLQICKKIIIM